MVAMGNAKVLFTIGICFFIVGMIFLFFISYRRSGNKATSLILVFLVMAGFVLVMESSKTLHYARSVGTPVSLAELEEEKLYEILLLFSVLPKNIAMVGTVDSEPDVRLVWGIPAKMQTGIRFKISEKKVIKEDFVKEAPEVSF